MCIICDTKKKLEEAKKKAEAAGKRQNMKMEEFQILLFEGKPKEAEALRVEILTQVEIVMDSLLGGYHILEELRVIAENSFPDEH